jgi:DNA polymerase-1
MLSSAKRQGKNTPMQGGGADVTKKAMIYVYDEIEDNGYDARILKVVHDELVVEVREDQAEVVAKMVEREMIHGFTYFFKRIPMRVDAKISDTWAK